MSTKNSWVPAIPDPEILPPPPEPLPQAPSIRKDVQAENAWFVLTFANVLVAAIIVAGMLVDGSTTGRAILYGSLYFFLTMTIFVLALTGTLTDIVRGRQREITERERIAAYADLGEQAIRWRQTVEDNRRMEILRESLPGDMSKRLAAVERALLEGRGGRGDAEGVQPPTWVTPYDNRGRGAFAEDTQPPADTTRDEALAWARGLYLRETGDPDPDAVWLTQKPSSHGKLRGQMIGSARGDGSNEARLWLLDRRIIVATRGGYMLNLSQYPRADTLYYVD